MTTHQDIAKSTLQKWPRSVAINVARELCGRLKPYCEKLIVAGSLRRRKAEVSDVEILYISRIEERPLDMFSTQYVSLADEEILRMLADGTLTKRLSKTGSTAWGDKNKLGVHRSGMPVDFFRTVPESWWNYLVCRTGPAASNTRIATEAQRRGYRWNPYGSGYTKLADGTVTAMNSESAVFAFVGLPYAEPWERK